MPTSTDALWDSQNVGIFKVSLATDIEPFQLGYPLWQINELYLTYHWLDQAERSVFPLPDSIPVPPEERLYIRRLEIGTPNLVELIGLVPYIVPAFLLMAGALNMLHVYVSVVESVENIQQIKANKGLIDLQSEKLRLEIQEMKSKIDLLEKSERLHAVGKVTDEQLGYKQKLWTSDPGGLNVFTTIATEPEFTMFVRSPNPNQPFTYR